VGVLRFARTEFDALLRQIYGDYLQSNGAVAMHNDSQLSCGERMSALMIIKSVTKMMTAFREELRA
jgi:hypothetical protein